MKYPLLLTLAGLLASSTIASTQVIPPDTNGLQLWLDAGQKVTHAGGSISNWGSRVTTPYYQARQATVASQPQWIENATPTGQATVRFDGTNDRLILDNQITNITSSFTTFAVVSLSSLTTRQTIFDTKNGTSSNSGYYLVYRGDQPDQSFQLRVIEPGNSYRGLDLAISEALPGYEQQFFVIMTRVDSDETGYSLTLRVGDVEKTSSNTVTTFTDIAGVHPLTIGASSSPTAPSAFLNGDLSALLLYNRALDDTEAAAVMNYLQSYYVIPEPDTMALLITAPVLLLFVRRLRSA